VDLEVLLLQISANEVDGGDVARISVVLDDGDNDGLLGQRQQNGLGSLLADDMAARRQRQSIQIEILLSVMSNAACLELRHILHTRNQSGDFSSGGLSLQGRRDSPLGSVMSINASRFDDARLVFQDDIQIRLPAGHEWR